MTTDIEVLRFKHYDMGDEQKGASIIIVGENVETNNEQGMLTTESSIPYEELENLLTIGSEKFPAVFKATVEFGKIKDGRGKEKTGVTFSNLKYQHSLKFQKV